MISSETKAAPVSNSTGPGFEAWFTPGRFAILLGALLALTFLDVVTGQATFFYRDFGVFTYPVAYYQRECFWHGEIPLWNPLNNCGVPFLAQWNTSVLYPLSLFYLIFPLSWSLGVFLLGHLFLAGMGMFFLARNWTGNPLAAAIAGSAFAFNGLTWQMLAWVSNLAAWAWMPWVVLAVELAWRHGGSRRIAVAALAGAMQMLAGAPEIIFLTWCVAGIFWLLGLARAEAPRKRIFVRMLIVGLLVAGLVAAQLLPFLELLRHSNRDTNFGDLGWAMPLSGPANFLVPLFRCFRSGHGVYPQFEQYWTPSYYEGITIVALALLAVWRVRDWRVWLLAVVVFVGVLMALGPAGHLYSWIRAAAPQLGFIRYPIKFVVLPLFALPLLAACAVNWQGAAHTINPARARRDMFAVAIMLIGLVGFILWLDWSHPRDWENQSLIRQNGIVRVVMLVLAFGTLIQLRKQGELKKQLLFSLALLVLLWADIYTHAPEINPMVERAVYAPGMLRTTLKLPSTPQFGEPRAMSSLAAIDIAQRTYLEKPSAEYLCRRLALYQNCNLLDGIPKIDGFYSSALREPDQILSLLLTYDAKGAELKGFKDFLGIAYITAPGAANAGGLDWTNRTSFLPLITAGQKPVFADGSNAVAAMFGAEFDSRQTVYLPDAAKPAISATNQTVANVIPMKLNAQRLDFEVEANAPAMVTIAQTIHPPWHAYMDGRPTPLWRANYAFQALEVPAGRHRVSVIYEDAAFRWGTVITLVSVLGCGLMFIQRRPSIPE